MNNKYIRENFDGLTSEIHKWDLLKTSTILKPEYKEGNVEITCSYLNSVKCLYNDLIRQNHPSSKETLIRTNSLIIPFLFVCRHTIELAIKTALDDKNIVYGNTHNLKDLFSKIKIEKELSDDFKTFIIVLDLVDDKGMWLRYDKDLKSKKEYIEKSFFINSSEIMEQTEKLTSFLLNGINNQ